VSGVGIACTISLVALLWENIILLRYSWSVGSVQSLGELWWGLLAGTPSSLGWFSVILILVTAALFGVVLPMIWYIWRRKRTSVRWRQLFTLTGLGSFAAMLGVGCAACGTIVLSSILAMFGAGSFLLLLPLHGAEFGILAVLFLLYAIHALAKAVTAPAVCDVS
jgi:hypothetical protein